MLTDWLDTFGKYFEIASATDPTDVGDVLALRYQVYCVEHPFEDSARYRDGMEQDEFDPRSVHSLLRHRASGQVAATVRLILNDRRSDSQLLPIEKYCAVDHRLWADTVAGYSRHQIAEISRFAVSKQFRRRLGEAATTHGVVEPFKAEKVAEERRTLPQITLGLFQAILRMSQDHQIKAWVAVMEPTLLRLLRRFGIFFTPIGEPVDFHGLRIPCAGAVDEVVDSIRHYYPEVWEFVTCGGRLWPY